MNNEKYMFRAWDKKQLHMAYHGEPGVETLRSFMHRYSDCDMMLWSGKKNSKLERIFEGDIVMFIKRVFFVEYVEGEFFINDGKTSYSFNSLTKHDFEKFIPAGNIYWNQDIYENILK